MVSPGQTLRYEGRETTASGSLSFHRACASTKRLRQNVKLHHFFLFRRKYKELKHSTKQQQRERQKKNNWCDTQNQPLPQVTFLWLWEKRPGDEVEAKQQLRTCIRVCLQPRAAWNNRENLNVSQSGQQTSRMSPFLADVCF